ncbi:MAG: asparaginase [Chloroflexaceae bacterium]|nr:asparaginase [Chloroflexaceae bacterium]
MKHISVITTGGTTAIKRKQAGREVLLSLPGTDFWALVPHEDIHLSFEEFSNIPGSHFTPVNALKLSQVVESSLMSPDIYGVVITHGSDTIEETAYLLDLTTSSPKPIVVTGTVRHANTPDHEGLTNLVHAIRLAASPEARDLGVVLVSGGEIHAASQVQKVYTHSLNAFQSPGSGPLGRVESHRIWLNHRPYRRQYIPCSRLEESVDLIRIAQGADDRLLRHAIQDRVAGIVIEVFGSGRVPPWWLPAIGDAVAQRIVVAVTSRCVFGGLGDEHGYVGAYHDLQRLGVLMVHYLDGCKTRIKLMAALGAARSTEELRQWFAS